MEAPVLHFIKQGKVPINISFRDWLESYQLLDNYHEGSLFWRLALPHWFLPLCPPSSRVSMTTGKLIRSSLPGSDLFREFLWQQSTSSLQSVKCLLSIAGRYCFWLQSHLANLCDWNYWWLTKKKKDEYDHMGDFTTIMILQRMWDKVSRICTYTIWLKYPKTCLLTQISYIEGELTSA